MKSKELRIDPCGIPVVIGLHKEKRPWLLFFAVDQLDNFLSNVKLHLLHHSGLIWLINDHNLQNQKHFLSQVVQMQYAFYYLFYLLSSSKHMQLQQKLIYQGEIQIAFHLKFNYD